MRPGGRREFGESHNAITRPWRGRRHADLHKQGAYPGPFTLPQTVYKYNAIAKDLIINIQVPPQYTRAADHLDENAHPNAHTPPGPRSAPEAVDGGVRRRRVAERLVGRQPQGRVVRDQARA